MTGAEALDLLMSRLGNRTDSGLRAQILSEMKIAQEVQCHRLDFFPWFMYKSWNTGTTPTLVLNANDGYCALPTDFWGMDDDQGLCGLWTQDTATNEWRVLKRRNAAVSDEQDLYWNNYAADEPMYYDFTGAGIQVSPTSLYARNLTLTGFCKETVAPADTGGTTLWLTNAPDLLIGYTGYHVAKFIVRDTDAADMFTAYIDTAIKQLRIENERRIHMMKTYAMGED